MTITPTPSEAFAPQTPDPNDAPILAWGILGPGTIATMFATALNRRTGQRLAAVGSRSLERAERFAAEHQVAAAYGSYEELVADPAVDIVYVASPHACHEEHALLAIGAGKHVLIEKPLATSPQSADRIIAAAREARVFVMEAMWPRFRPQAELVRRTVESGVIGALTLVMTDFSDPNPYDPANPFPGRNAPGNVVDDIGVYPLSWASSLLGRDLRVVSATGTVDPAGYEDAMTVVLRSPSGAESLIHASWRTTSPTRSIVAGTAGYLEIDQPFFEAPEVRLYDGDRRLVDTWRDETGWLPGDALVYEAVACARWIAEGLLESPVLPLAESREVVALSSEVRTAIRAAAV